VHPPADAPTIRRIIPINMKNAAVLGKLRGPRLNAVFTILNLGIISTVYFFGKHHSCWAIVATT